MDKNAIIERCKKMIWDVSSALMSVVYTKNMTYSVVRLMFLKYVTDNCFKANTSEKMMDYVRVQKMFAARDNEGGQSAVYPILQMLDEEYKLDNILTSSLNEYAKDLFGTDDSWGRKNSTINHHKAVMAAVAELNLEDMFTCSDVDSVPGASSLGNPYISNKNRGHGFYFQTLSYCHIILYVPECVN